MVPRRLLLACAAVTAALAAAPAWAQDSASCAQTTDPSAPATPTAGEPCWTEVEPYPFGADGAPVDTTTPACQPPNPRGPSFGGDQASCFLNVESLAFRAWNRGLAATSGSAAFGVWLFNGTRWFPDGTFPGQAVCRGKTVLWAGKRDFWLIDARPGDDTFPSLCRFDGVNFEWQPLEVPAAALARVPLTSAGTRERGAVTAGSCLSWDDCWFYGSFGIVLRWDGTRLTDASPDLTAQPWLRTSFAAAATQAGPLGTGSVVAAGTSGGLQEGTQLPAQPDGTPPPQLFRSGGGTTSALPYSPPTVSRPDDPYRTDLASIAFDAKGRGWLAGNPAGDKPTNFGQPGGTRRATSPEPAPLVRLTADGSVECSALPPGQFTFPAGAPGGPDGYLWSSVAVAPEAGDTADMVAGGLIDPASPSPPNAGNDGSPEPLLLRASCEGPPIATRFRTADPFVADPSKAASVPAGRTGFITSVASNASNDAWAATSRGRLDRPRVVIQRPRLYRLSDARPPDAPAGDDVESRPLVFEADPPIFVELPPDPEPPVPPDTTATVVSPPLRRPPALKPAIYGVSSRVEKTTRRKRTTYTLVVRFRVRRPVTIGVEALRRRTLVGKSGLKRFRQPAGKLSVRLDRRRWPTRIRFVSPKPAAPRVVTGAPAIPKTAPK